MYFFRNKIRKLNELLNENKLPKDLLVVKEALEKAAPKPARPQFQKDLRTKLLSQYAVLPDKASKNVRRKRGWSFALAFLLILMLSGLVSYPLIPAPQVDGYFLKGGVRKIAFNAPIKISFTQMMDKDSVEKAFHIEPKVEGNFTWSLNSLFFQPKKPFKIGDVYSISLDRHAKSIFQKSLPSPYLEDFEITGAPKVLLFSPANDSTDVPTDAQITVHFDRPMVALTTLNQGIEIAPIFDIKPKVSGKIQWLGTDSVRFIPEKLLNATRYEITVPKGTSSADGGKTEEDFKAAFDTLRPRLVRSEPTDDNEYVYGGNLTFAGPDTKVKLFFNQSMSPEKAKHFIHLYAYTGDKKAINYLSPEWISYHKNYDPSSLQPGVKSPVQPKLVKKTAQTVFGAIGVFEKGSFEEIPFTLSSYDLSQYKLDNGYEEDSTEEYTWPETSELQKTLVMTPNKPLGYDRYYLVKIDKDLPGAEGDFTIEEEKKILIKTVGDVRILNTYPKNGEEKFYGPGGAVRISFSQPMDIESFENKVEFLPKSFDQDTKEEKKPIFSQYDQNTITIGYDFEPSTGYTVILKPGLKDLYGKTYDRETALQFTTTPLTPNFTVTTREDVDIVDANGAPVFYLQSTNISKVHINFKKLPREEFEKYYQNGYVHFPVDNVTLPELTASWDKPLKKTFNRTEVQKIDFAQETGSKLEPGYYYFDVSSEETPRRDRLNKPWLEEHIFVVTSTALTAKIGKSKVLVWATSLSDGNPVEGMDITIKPNKTTYDNAEVYNDNEKIEETVVHGKTDKNGLITLNIPEGFRLDDSMIYGQKGDDLTFVRSDWSDGIEPGNFDINYDPNEPKYFAYVYTDRPIYRPGDTVYFKGLMRLNRDAIFALPDIKNADIFIYDEGKKVLEETITLNKNGTFHGQLTLGSSASTGAYRIEVNPSDGEDSLATGGASVFQVAEYRKPDYQLTVSPDRESYVNGDTAKIKIMGSYFFGAPMPGAQITWSLKSDDYFFFLGPDSKSPYASNWFSFSDSGFSCYFRCEGEEGVVATGAATLDANGEFTLQLPLNITDKKISQFYSIEVTASNLNNQTVSNRSTIVVHRGEYYVGILNAGELSRAGKPTSFQIITVDKDGAQMAGKNVEVSFYKRAWNTVKKKNVDSDFYYENSYVDTLLEKKTVTTNEKGFAEVAFTPLEGGIFKAVASSKDSRNNVITTSDSVYVSSSTFINWGRENNDRIELVPDKPEYKPGDIAHILLKSPYQKVNALVTYERADIFYQKLVRIDSNSEVIDVPITDKHVPNIFISVVLVKGSNNNAGLGEPDKKALDEREIAAFKVGYTLLQVNNSSKKLTIELASDQQKYRPGDEVTLKVTSKDAAGKPVKAEISLSVVDKSVLSLTENFTADLLNEFYRTRSLGILTVQTLTKALSRVNVQVEAGLKGGGGGSGVLKRDNFADMAFWKSVLQTDVNGRGEVTFKIPDNLTTWQVLAIGITPQTQVGSQKTEFLVTKDVLVRPVLPRFLIVNDTMTVSGIVHNYLERPMDFDVRLEAKGVTLTGSPEKRISLAPGEEQKVYFPLTVQNEREAVFTFKAISSENQSTGDVLEIKVPIHPFSFAEVVSSSSVLDDGDKHVETIWLPSNIDRKLGELTLSVAPTLASGISKGIEYLVQYPYGCNEQTASSLLPNLVVKQMINLPGVGKNIEKLIDPQKLKKNAEAGIQSLSKNQQGNGGWGLWADSNTSPYVSAYVLFTLNEAQKAGYTVDKSLVERGLKYLKNALQRNTGTGLVDMSSDYASNKNSRAYMLYVLSEMGKGDLGLSNNLYENRKNVNLFAKAYLAMNFQLLIQQEKLTGSGKEDIEKKIQTLQAEILKFAKETPRGVHFEETQLDYMMFDTNTRTTALVLQMLIRVDEKNPLIPKILRYLLQERQNEHFDSTHETAVSLLSLIDYLKISGELDVDYDGVITLNGAEKLQKSFTSKNLSEKGTVSIPLTELLQNNMDNEIIAVRNGKGKMYFDMNLKYYLPTEKIDARDEGILVHQEYFSMEDIKEEHPLTGAKIGDVLKGKITIIVPEHRYYVMVEDFLPAGLEGVDFDLNISDQGLRDSLSSQDCMSWKCWAKYWYFHHSEVRDDRMMYFADYLPAGVYDIEYFVRATTPGVFHDLPTQASETYFPEVFGRSGGRTFTVNN